MNGIIQLQFYTFKNVTLLGLTNISIFFSKNISLLWSWNLIYTPHSLVTSKVLIHAIPLGLSNDFPLFIATNILFLRVHSAF